MSICNGVAGRRGHNPIGIFIHNDAGSKNANVEHYRSYLQNVNLANGFAHAYVCDNGTLFAEDDGNCAWHCGQTDGNRNYYSIEVCQSMGDLDTFKANEEKALKLAAQKCKQYGITPNSNTIRLHREVYATACPHRSVEIHGGVANTKEYFIRRIKELMNPPAPAPVLKILNASVQPNTGADFMRMSMEHIKDNIYKISDKKQGFYMTVADSEDGSNVDFRNFDCGNYQLWRMVKKTYKSADYTMFESVAAPGKFLSVENNGQDGKDNLKLWSDLHNQKQKFYIREESDGRTLIIHVFTGNCVSAHE